MNKSISTYLASIGRKGGKAKSKAKSLAAKRNIEKRWAKVRAKTSPA